MSGRCYTAHARERAFERYGLRLVDEDFATILADCLSGRAPCMRRDTICRIHVAKYAGKNLIVALMADRDVIVTFQPPDYFRAGGALAHRTKRQHGKTTPSVSAIARRDDYSRAKFKREITEHRDDE